VLIVEDEESWSDALSYMLRKGGYEVDVAETGPAGVAQFDQNGADLVLLDVMLPQMSGLEVCRHLRARSDVPIIMVSAHDSEVDRIVGLEVGADDYVTKPYSGRELLARVKAVLRRQAWTHPQAIETVLTAGRVHMNLDRHVVTVDGAPVSLALKEFHLLELLLRNVGRVLTRNQIIARVWGRAFDGDPGTLDVHIKRIRSKIEIDPHRPRQVRTVRRVGYKFEP
jgi:two-component system response regulator RegX3